MLTKEECEKALETLSSPPYESSCGGCICGVSDCGDCPNNKANKLLNKLIDEHFDNPPLKFEEIRPDDWVWDKKNKEWRQVNFAGVVGKDDELMFYEDVFKKGVKIVAFKNFRSVVFEENRFYRKEVQDV